MFSAPTSQVHHATSTDPPAADADRVQRGAWIQQDPADDPHGDLGGDEGQARTSPFLPSGGPASQRKSPNLAPPFGLSSGASRSPLPLDAGAARDHRLSPAPDAREEFAFLTATVADDDLPLFPDPPVVRDDLMWTPLTHVPQASPARPSPVDPPWAILALQPVPLATLAARPARDPLTMRQLRALMQASSPKRAAHLRAQLGVTLPGGTSRQYLTRLTDEEVAGAARAASADAARVSGGMAAAGYHALDRLLGKAVTVAMLTGQPHVRGEGPAHRSDQPVPPRRVIVDSPTPAAYEADGALQPGRAWQHKKSGRVVVIARMDDGAVTLMDGRRVTVATFITAHRRVARTQAGR